MITTEKTTLSYIDGVLIFSHVFGCETDNLGNYTRMIVHTGILDPKNSQCS